jgi:putative ABC transport system substrate-binding protein
LLGVEASPIDSRDGGEIERRIAEFTGPQAGLVVPSGGAATFHRELILALVARHRVPTVYSSRSWVAGGGLISYGSVQSETWRYAAGYVDRILKGEKPGDLPVQLPTRYETVLNMQTAKALDLDVPTSVLLRADEVIE